MKVISQICYLILEAAFFYIVDILTEAGDGKAYL
jgi:hypothetical protein